MTKAEFIGAVTSKLRELNIRKSVRIPKEVFKISDSSGTTRKFVVQRDDRSEAYTMADVRNILEVIGDIIKETMAHGEQVQLGGFGTFGLKFRNKRIATHPVTGETINIDERYVPMLWFAPEFKIFSKLYEPPKNDTEDTDPEDDKEDGMIDGDGTGL